MDLSGIRSSLFPQTIKPGSIYKFSSTQINTPIRHYFICIVRDDGDCLILACCTSQFEGRKNYVERNAHIPESPLVWIAAPNEDNELTEDTYVNCNNYFEYRVEDLRQKYDAGTLDYKGEVSESHYVQIINGMRESPEIEEDIKDRLPSL